MSRDRDVRENRLPLVACLLAAQIFGAAALAPAVAQQPSQDLSFAGSLQAYAGSGSDMRISDFSGQPVPRYASLKSDKVNGRSGPSTDYPVEWTYQRLGLPVVVIRESQDWRKIQDPQGDEVWVKKSLLAAERTAMTTENGAIHAAPDDHSKTIADYHPGAVVILGECKRDWCRVEAGDLKGWALRRQLWGVEELS